MTGVLSNEQIDALFSAANEGSLPRAERERAPRRRVREIDFLRPAKLQPDQLRRLEHGHDGFCRSAAIRLSAELRQTISLEILGLEQVAWSAALAQAPQPSIFAIAETSSETPVVVTAELPLVLRLIERLLGGVGLAQHERRELTEIEAAVARRLFERLIEELSSTWGELLGMTLKLRAIESHDQNIRVSLPSEPSLALTIESRIEGDSATLSILFPYHSIEAAADRLSGTTVGRDAVQDPESEAALARMLREVRVPARVEVASVELPLEQVLALRQGDVVPLGVPATAGVTIFAGDIPLYCGSPGRFGTRRAVSVESSLERGR